MQDEKNINGTDGNDGVDDVDASVITAAKAYSMIRQELTIANSIGAKAGGNAEVAKEVVDDATGKTTFAITQKGKYDVQEALNFQLHVGPAFELRLRQPLVCPGGAIAGKVLCG